MLYTRTELKEMNTFEKCKIPLERYMHKFVCERKNINDSNGMKRIFCLTT